MAGIEKRFGSVVANRDVNLSVAAGTIHGLVGENGAGKSTLMSILYGFYTADAGGTGIGVYQAAKDAGKLAIGVDSNQNGIQPGTMLTSMLKRVDVAVYNAAKNPTPGVSALGLKEGGVDYAMDANNDKLVSADMRDRKSTRLNSSHPRLSRMPSSA